MQDLIALFVMLAVLVSAWHLRAVTVPALIAWLLAYLFNPLVSRAREAWRWPRALTTSVCVVLVLAAGAGTLAWLIPRVVQDGMAVARDLPSHVQRVSGWLQSTHMARLAEAVRDSLSADSGALLDGTLGLMGAVATALGTAAYGMVSLLFGIATFTYLSIRFPELPRPSRLIPASHRAAVLDVLARFEAAFGGFLRGQVVVAVFTTAGFIAGFSLVGVPHASLAGVIGGLFSFVPNGQLIGLLMAWLFGVLEAGNELQGVPVLLYPALVYGLTQTLETFVITPLVQGRRTRMHPLWVMGALIAGGSVGGLLGIFLAIPVTACLKIVLVEVLWPELQGYLARS